jgi:hypothetical protein
VSEGAHPYRDAPLIARFVCIACHRSLSSSAGACPGCHVDRLDLARPDVRDEVRQHAERQLQRGMMREELLLGAISFVAATAAWFAFVGDAVPDGARFARSIAWTGLISLIARFGLRRLYLALRPNAAIAILAARRRRLGIPALQPEESTPAADASAIDPEVADLQQLLVSLGAKLDG